LNVHGFVISRLKAAPEKQNTIRAGGPDGAHRVATLDQPFFAGALPAGLLK
jgi:hypothetical protein